MRATEITRLPQLDETRFYRDYYGAAPVLLPAFVRGSRACAKWSPEYLEAAISDKVVEVHYCERALEKTTEGAVRAPSQHFDAPFRKASELIRASSEVVYFLMGQPIREMFPELLADLDFDELILRAAPLFSVNLWYAAAGHVTPLHYDTYDNFLNQIIGRKQITLFPPSDKEYLYSPSTDGADNPGMVNLFESDAERFPHFRRATPIKFILEPGDTLYLPAGWSHQIESLDETVSVNFFFGGRASPLA